MPRNLVKEAGGVTPDGSFVHKSLSCRRVLLPRLGHWPVRGGVVPCRTQPGPKTVTNQVQTLKGEVGHPVTSSRRVCAERRGVRTAGDQWVAVTPLLTILGESEAQAAEWMQLPRGAPLSTAAPPGGTEGKTLPPQGPQQQ